MSNVVAPDASDFEDAVGCSHDTLREIASKLATVALTEAEENPAVALNALLCTVGYIASVLIRSGIPHSVIGDLQAVIASQIEAHLSNARQGMN